MRSGLNGLLLRASVSRLSKFVLYQCLNTDLNSSQAFKRATFKSRLKPFRKERNRGSSLISLLLVQKHTQLHMHNYHVLAFINYNMPAASPGKEVSLWYSEHLQTLG